MRLLRTTDLKFEVFEGRAIPQYAILSHTWGLEEVLFQDMEHGRGAEKSGYIKIQKCIDIAKSDNWAYLWIDTCCIDKSSSAELTESINSMFTWYENAEV
jgi:Heterokaryon incompatibility protein (HET)